MQSALVSYSATRQSYIHWTASCKSVLGHVRQVEGVSD